MKPHNRHRKLFVLHKDHFKLFELSEGPSGAINGAHPAAYCGLMVPIWSPVPFKVPFKVIRGQKNA